MKVKYLIYSILWIVAIILLSNYVNAQEIKVMIIDTGVDYKHTLIERHIDDNDILTHPESYTDTINHGTHVGYLAIKDTCSQVKLISCKYYFPNEDKDRTWLRILNCFRRVHTEHIDYVNFSSSGEEPSEMEYDAIKYALEGDHTKMMVAAGNEGKNLGSPCFGAFPACYGLKNLIPVGNLNENKTRQESSNYGIVGMKWMIGTNILSALPNNLMGKMTGTSQATAKYTNFLIKERCKELNNGQY